LPDAGYQNTGNGGFLNYDINGQAPSRWHPFTQTLFIEHEKQVDKNWSWAAKMYQRKTGVDKDSYSYFYLGDNQFELGRWAHESKRLGLDLQLNYKTSDNQSWIIGVQYVDDDLEKGYRAIEDGSESLLFDGNEYLNLGAEFMAADKLKQNNLGIFSQVITQTDFNGKTDVTLGVRFDDNESYGSSVSPRLGLVNQVSPESNWIFKANYGEAFRAPAVFERFSASTVRVANPDLRPEEVKTFELAMSYQFERSIIQATWFSNHLSDVITAVLLPDGKNQNQNVGSIDVNGLELIFNHEFSKSAKLMFNYTYQTGEQKSASAIFDIPNIANHKFNIGLDYIINENTNLYINGNWVGKRSVAVSNPLTEVDGYFVSNLSLSKKNIFNSPLEFNWRVNNLFDATYLDPGIRSADGQGIFATVHEQIGRNYSFELSYWF
jgi:outer membrane receptor for ferrienterochelin and colicin